MPPQDGFKLRTRTALAAAIAMALPASAFGAAARVDFAIGQVTAVGSDGQERKIRKGASIEAGETISTKRGRAQLRFSDGAYVSLKPETDFRVDDYNFSGKEDGSERAFLSLLRGGFRTLTGLIGKTNQKAYKVETPIATIGIRGTGYEAVITNPLRVNVSKGSACLLGVCAGPGQYLLMEPGGTPQVFQQGTETPATETPQEGYELEIGQECSGDACEPDILSAIFDFNVDPTCDTFNCTVGFVEGAEGIIRSLNATFTNPPTAFADSEGNTIDVGTAQAEGVSLDGVVSWWRWFDGVPNGSIPCPGGDPCFGNNFGPLDLTDDGPFESVHGYVAIPATQAEIEGANPIIGNFSLNTASPPTTTDGDFIGVLEKADFSINFSSGAVAADFQVLIFGLDDGDDERFFAPNLGGTLVGADFFLDDDFETTSSGSSCLSFGCATFVNGTVATGLGHVGFGYEIERPFGNNVIGSGIGTDLIRIGNGAGNQ